MSHPDQHQAIDELRRDEREFPFTGPLGRAHRQHLITKLVDH